MDNIKSTEVGKNIFENIPNNVRPGWAGFVLSRFDSYLDQIPTEISELQKIISSELRWKEAHSQFSAIRELTLNADGSRSTYLTLAEKVAKVTYNESGDPAPFDSSSGHLIPSLAIEFSQQFEDDNLYQEVKSAILIFNRNKQFKKDIQAASDFLLYKRIDNILWLDWDPIGVNDYAPRDEYQSYVPQLFRLKKQNAKRDEIAEKLLMLERDVIGKPSNLDNCRRIADKILAT
ncbi:MAG: hypothetical protein WBB45_07135 [Cyclobacteriaceae bacterium]